MDPEALAVDVQCYIQPFLSRYIEELRELCSIDSHSYYKLGLDEVASWLAARMRGLGATVRVIEQEQWGNDLLGVFHGKGKSKIVLLGHIDTVYPAGTAAERPLRIEGNKVYGPGVMDMKGCVLLAIYAIEALRALDYHSFGEIRLLCVSDEEIHMRHSESLIHQVLQDCDMAFVLEAGGEENSLVRARKGWAAYTLSAHGQAAHAGIEPDKGHSAVVELAHQILQFRSLNGWCKGLTINPCTFSGGTAANVIPDYAEATIDLRTLHSQDKKATEKRWREMMQHQVVSDVTLRLDSPLIFKEPMMETPESTELLVCAQKIARTLGFELGHELRGGASDASYASQLNIPVLDGLGPVGGLDHTPNEYLKLDTVVPRTALLAGMIASVDL